MSVYFIGISGRYIKVGYSTNPERRLRNLFASATRYVAPWDCSRKRADRSLIGYVDGYYEDEQTAHWALGDFMVASEFVLDEPEVRDYIARCVAAGGVVDAQVERPGGRAEWVSSHPPFTDEEVANLNAALERMFARSAS